MSEQIQDALALLSIPQASPTLEIVKKVTDNKEHFQISHTPMACPPVPSKPGQCLAGKRSHELDTLTGLQIYIDHIDANDSAIAFYRNDVVQCVIDEDADFEKEIIKCALERANDFSLWSAILGKPMSQAVFVSLLRTHRDCIVDGAEDLIGVYSSLSGTLVHSADEFLDQQGRSASFTVKRKKRGSPADTENEVADVPAEFKIRLPILQDDAKPTEFVVMVRMTGEAGAQIVFSLEVMDFDTLVDVHIDQRLQDFSDSCGFVCVRGSYQEQKWSEPQLPQSVMQLMDQQTKMIEALSGTSKWDKED